MVRDRIFFANVVSYSLVEDVNFLKIINIIFYKFLFYFFKMPPKRNSQGGGGNRGPGGGGGRSLKQMYNSLSLRDEYRLTLNENAWKPSKLTRTQESKSKEEREMEVNANKIN